MSKTMKAIVLALVLCVLFALGATAMAADLPTEAEHLAIHNANSYDWDNAEVVKTHQAGDCDSIGVYTLQCDGVYIKKVNGVDTLVRCDKVKHVGYYNHVTVEKVLPGTCAYTARLGDFCVLCNEYIANNALRTVITKDQYASNDSSLWKAIYTVKGQHDWVEVYDDAENDDPNYRPGTCAKPGAVTAQCRVCNKVEVVVMPVEHTMTGTRTEAPSCGSGTRVYIYCAVCGYEEFAYELDDAGKDAKHEFYGAEKEFGGNCSEPSVWKQYCTKCKKWVENPLHAGSVKPNVHKWETEYYLTPATCTEAGVAYQICALCGETQYATVAAGHVADESKTVEVKAATCKDFAQYKKFCTVCQKFFDELGTTKLAHNFTKEDTYKAGDCKNKALLGMRCTNKQADGKTDCGEWLTDGAGNVLTKEGKLGTHKVVYLKDTELGKATITIGGKGYSFVDKDGKAVANPQNEKASCDVESYKVWYYCSVCSLDDAKKNVTIYQESKAGGHQIKNEYRKADCMLPERWVDVCTVCGEEFNEDAFGKPAYTVVPGGDDKLTYGAHSYGFNAGQNSYFAGNHITTYEQFYGNIQKNHNMTDSYGWKHYGIVAPTCGTTGYVYAKCQNAGCNSILVLAQVPAVTTMHKVEKADSVVTEENCLTETRKVIKGTCVYCKTKNVEYTLPELEHKYVYEVEKEPNCIETGVTNYICTVCGDKGSESTKATSETGTHGKMVMVVVPATCYKREQVGEKCEDCGWIDTTTLENTDNADLLPHTIKFHKNYLTEVEASTGKKYEAPTCATPGYGLWYCAVEECTEHNNGIAEWKAIPMTGHKWVYGSVEPNCLIEGYEFYQCSECKQYDSKYKWSDNKYVTNIGDGNTYYTEFHKTADALAANPTTAAKWHNVPEYVYGNEKASTKKVSGSKMTYTGTKTEATCVASIGYEFECSECGLIKNNANITDNGLFDKDNHDYVLIRDIEAATCNKGGVAEYKCSLCNKVVYEGTEAKHNYVFVKYTVEPTCGKPGKADYECSECDAVLKDQVVPALSDKHVEGKYEVRPADCDYPAMAGTWCTVCKLPVTAKAVEGAANKPLGHDWKITKWIKEPTCVESGLAEKTCQRCNLVAADYTDVEEGKYAGTNQLYVPATDAHTFGDWDVIPENCTYHAAAARICSVCDEIVYLDADAAKKTTPAVTGDVKLHKYVWNSVTCLDKNGKAKLVCTVPGCGNVWAIATSAISSLPTELQQAWNEFDGHQWTELRIDVPATCYTPGVKTRFCELCETTQVVSYNAKHDYTGAKIEVNATGTLAYKRCIICGAPAEALVLDNSANFKKCDPKHIGAMQPFAGRPATATESGLTAGAYCDNCGELVGVQVIPATGCEHEWETIPAVAATCTTAGATEGIKCAKCGAWQKEIIVVPALNHKLEDRAGKAAECGVDGYTAYKACVNPGCDYEEGKEVIKAEPHELTVIEAVAPTCTTPGNTKGEKCSKCGYEVAATYLAPLGHTEKVIAAVAPTCTTAGSTEGKVCTVCNAELVAVKEVAALGHTITSTFAFDRDATGKIIGKIRTDVCSVCKVSTETKLGLHD